MSRDRSRSPHRNVFQPPRLLFLANQTSQSNNPIMSTPPPVVFPAGFSVSLLNEIPSYDGNPSALSEFIRSAEVITIQFCTQNPNDYINKLIISSIRNKLKDQALEVVTGYHYDTWNELKRVLVENFGDQRSELNLLVDLTKLRQNRDTPIEFFNKIRTHLAIFNSKISLGDEDPAVKNYKLLANKSLALRTFVSGLNENLGSFIRSRNPNSLEEALKMVKEELDIRYSQNQNNKSFPNSNQTPNKPNNQNYPKSNVPLQNLYTPRYNNFVPNQNYTIRQPFPQRNQNFNPNNPMRFPPSNSRNFQNPNRNVFAPGQNKQFMNKPEPMDFSTIKRPASQQLSNPNKYRVNSQNTPINQQSNQARNFASEQLHYIDSKYSEIPENYQYAEYNERNYSEEIPADYEESYPHPCDNEQLDHEQYYSVDNETDAGNFY